MEGRPDFGGFEDLEAAMREGLERLRTSPELVARDRVRGLIYDPATEELESFEDQG